MADSERHGITVYNFDRDLIHAKLDRDEKDRLIINEIRAGKKRKLLEVRRCVGPLSADCNNNILC